MKEAVAALRGAKRIGIVSHRDPDGDTIGSAVALALALDQLGKRVTLHCADPVPDSFRFIPGGDRFVREAPGEVDLVVTVDHGDRSRAKLTLPGVPLLNIDHHASNDLFGDINFVDPTSAATGEMIARVVDALEVPWTAPLATAILLAVMTDTGSFQFPNTDARTLRVAARALEAGADLPAITYNVYRSRRAEAMKLWGIALARLERDTRGELVWTWLEERDLSTAGARQEDVSGLVEQVARSTGNRLALLFNATEPGRVRVSARTSPFEPSVDAAALMGAFGGGGHARAAGGIVPGSLPEVRERVLAAARSAIEAARAAVA
ncbi:MAG: DHH family phosphoesterase [Chloroflexi bacterium]|nr:DHH family phosphoesterase [Chloroflexota bacterium]